MGQCAHLKNYVAMNDVCEVTAIAEIRPRLAEKVAKKYSIPNVYNDHVEMLEKEKLDGIVASQPFQRHGVLVPELLRAKIPLFTEKPLSGTIESGKKIVDILRKSETWMMVGYHKRSDLAIEWAKKEIDRLKSSGEIGKVKYVRITMPAGDWVANRFSDLIWSDEKCPKLPTEEPAKDMDNESFTHFIGFVNYYIHQVNLMRYLIGEDYDFTYVDFSGVVAHGQSISGIPCVIEMSPYCTTIDWQESALACFEKGWIRLELPAPLAYNRPGKVSVFKDCGNGKVPSFFEPQLPWEHAMRRQALNFIRAIKGEIKPLCTAEEALEDLKLARKYLKLFKGV